jgi:hypothetical protein
MKTAFRVLAGLVLFLVPAAAARADVTLPPTLCFDFMYLDRPYCFIVGCFMFGGATAFGLWLRQKRVPWLLAITVPVVLFISTDIGLYVYGYRKQANDIAEARRKRTQFNQVQQNAPVEKLSVPPKEVD